MKDQQFFFSSLADSWPDKPLKNLSDQAVALKNKISEQKKTKNQKKTTIKSNTRQIEQMHQSFKTCVSLTLLQAV